MKPTTTSKKQIHPVAFYLHNPLLYSILFLFFLTNSNAQQKYEYLYRTDLSFEQRVELGERYFETIGKQRGNGYTQFQRWKYWAARSLDSRGMVITEEQKYRETMQFKSTYGSTRNQNNTLTFTELGPQNAINTSTWSSALARLTSLAFANEDNFDHIIGGSPTGGVWKTTDGGNSWAPIFDNQTTMNVYSVEISHANSQHYFVGTLGGGIYKSTDGGTSWVKTSGTWDGNLYNTIRMHPTNSSILYALGQWWGYLYKSTDGGDTWVRLTLPSDAHIYDLEFKPDDPSTIYVSGAGKIYKSTDDGQNFTTLTGGFSLGVIMMAVTPANADYLYAAQENAGSFHALFRSTDAGNSFTTVSDNTSGTNNLFGYSLDEYGGQAPRDMDIIASPLNADHIQIAGIESHRSTNGGSSWSQNTHWYIPSGLSFHHADVDALYYVYKNSTLRIYAATDGGIYVSNDNGQTFSDLTPGIGARQFYKIGVSKLTPDVVVGGSQDNGTGVLRADGNWYDWLGADGMETFVDHSNDQRLFGTTQFGNLYYSTNTGNTFSNLNKPESNGAWVTPFEQDPVNPNTIYSAYQQAHKSTDSGISWTAISSFTIDPNDALLKNLKIAPSDNNTIYAAYDHKIFRTTNGGTNWTDITPGSNFDANTIINHIALHPTNAQRLIITLSASPTTSMFLESTDGGTSWTDITSNLPAVGANCAVFVADDKDGIFVGTNPGLYYKDNTSSGNWSDADANNSFPNVDIGELEIAHNTLYIGTYGRGLWKTVIQETCPVALTLNDNTIPQGTYQAAETIVSAGQIAAGDTITMRAGNSISLNPGFNAVLGARFSGVIGPCAVSLNKEKASNSGQDAAPDTEYTELKEIRLLTAPNPAINQVNFKFYTEYNGQTTIQILNMNGVPLMSQQVSFRSGWNVTSFNIDQLQAGSYLVNVNLENERLSDKFIVIRQ